MRCICFIALRLQKTPIALEAGYRDRSGDSELKAARRFWSLISSQSLFLSFLKNGIAVLRLRIDYGKLVTVIKVTNSYSARACLLNIIRMHYLGQ